MNEADDLGFRHHLRKSGEVEIVHRGRHAALLRGPAASRFLAALERSDEAGAQQLMARATGQYRFGNERAARQHPRRRDTR